MSRYTVRWVLGLLVMASMGVSCNPARAQQVTDEELRSRVKNGIEMAQRFLINQQERDGSFPSNHKDQHPVGSNSLVGLALIYSGVKTDDPAIQNLLRYIRKQPDPELTYSRGLGIMFLCAAGEAKTRDRGKITAWANELVRSQRADGSWGYQFGDGNSDNSNAQYAILGLRDAAFYAGVEIEPQVWRRIQKHWVDDLAGPVQGASGWSYGRNIGGGAATGSMTVAGLASLEIASSFIVNDKLTPDGKLDCCGNELRPTADLALDAAIRWLDGSIQISSNPGAGGSWLHYYLYGLERAGKFSGRRFFGNTDWYREGARFLTDSQSKIDGSIGGGNEGPVVGTAMGLLFLSKGLSPVLINKLEYGKRNGNGRIVDNAWNRHRRDVSNLVDYISLQDKWPHYISWQTLDLQVAVQREGVAALQQAPVAYLSGDQDLDSMTEEEVNLLREYIIQGGFLFGVQNCDSPKFDQGFRSLITKMFPAGDYQLRKLEPTHDIYRSEEVFSSDPPELWGVDFGCRTAIVYAPFDHACRWAKWIPHVQRENAQIKLQIVKSLMLGKNVIAYATGRELRDKLQRPESLAKLEDSSGLTIGRLKHSGGWDTAANAVKHLQIQLSKVGIGTNPESPVLAANDPALFDCPLLYMHGGKNFSLTPDETTKLKAYFDNGGFLMADACCGSKKFDDSFRKAIKQIFGKDLAPIPVEHELFHMMSGYELGKVRCRIPDTGKASALSAEESIREPAFEGIEVNGRYVVVYSKYDISCALERQQTVACAGYLDEDAVKLATNIVLYSLFQ